MNLFFDAHFVFIWVKSFKKVYFQLCPTLFGLRQLTSHMCNLKRFLKRDALQSLCYHLIVLHFFRNEQLSRKSTAYKIFVCCTVSKATRRKTLTLISRDFFFYMRDRNFSYIVRVMHLTSIIVVIPYKFYVNFY